MKRPNITPETWEVSDTSIIAGDTCIAVIETDGGYEAEPEVRKANAVFITASPKVADALNEFLDLPLIRDLAAKNGHVFSRWNAAKAALIDAGFTHTKQRP